MGSGLFASAGFGNASYFRNPYCVAPSGVSYWADNTTNTLPKANACYTRSNLLSGAPPMDRYFSWADQAERLRAATKVIL